LHVLELYAVVLGERRQIENRKLGCAVGITEITTQRDTELIDEDALRGKGFWLVFVSARSLQPACGAFEYMVIIPVISTTFVPERHHC
jgi:hypothetical protein